MAEELVNEMMGEVIRLGVTYDAFSRRVSGLPPTDVGDEITDMGELPRYSFVAAALDRWPNSFSENFCRAIEAVNSQSGTERKALAENLIEVVTTAFDRPPRFERTTVSLEQAFRDLVNLPIWKKRHELYAVWVASRIAEALSSLSWEWHPDGDTLRFSFGGVELATLRDIDGTHVFWTEKKTPLKGGGLFGRRHIQPDYRIVTFPTHRDDATSLVVECKQYRKWNRKNFGAALDDYAKGCSSALVVLVNYGPTDPAILDLVDPSRRERTFLVGNFRPNSHAALDLFRELVQRVFGIDATARIITPVEITLEWGQEFQDLDLHLVVRPADGTLPTHVGLGSPGDLSQQPWAAWPVDVRNSTEDGERILIGQWLDAEYDVWVHDYSGTSGFPQGDVLVRLIEANGVEAVFRPDEGMGRWWHVCRVHGATAVIDEVNSVTDAKPDGVP